MDPKMLPLFVCITQDRAWQKHTSGVLLDYHKLFNVPNENMLHLEKKKPVWQLTQHDLERWHHLWWKGFPHVKRSNFLNWVTPAGPSCSVIPTTNTMPYDTFDVVPLAGVATCIRLQFRKWMRRRKSTVCTKAVNQNIILFEAQRRRQTESIQASACWVTRRCCSTAWWNLIVQTWRSIYGRMYLFTYCYNFIPVSPCCGPTPVFISAANGQTTHFSHFASRSTFKQKHSIFFALSSSPWEREKNTQQVIHCSIVLWYMTPGSWDILDVLELWSWGYSTRPNVGCGVCRGGGGMSSWLGTQSKSVPVIWMINVTSSAFCFFLPLYFYLWFCYLWL